MTDVTPSIGVPYADGCGGSLGRRSGLVRRCAESQRTACLMSQCRPKVSLLCILIIIKDREVFFGSQIFSVSIPTNPAVECELCLRGAVDDLTGYFFFG